MAEMIGYEGILRNYGKFVSADDALDYAMDQCGIAIVDIDAPDCGEFAAMLEEWFYSDNWVEVYGE